MFALKNAWSPWIRLRGSMFWKVVLILFVASCFATAVFVYISTVLQYRQSRAALSPERFEPVLQEELRTLAPLLEGDTFTPAFCDAILRPLAWRLLGERLDDNGPNRLGDAMRDGRIGLALVRDNQEVCRFPHRALQPALADNMRAAWSPHPVEVRQPGAGWVSKVSIATSGHPDNTLVVGVHVLRPMQTLGHGTWLVVGLYVLTLNLFSAVALVLLTVRRIRKAEAAAAAWTQGRLETRINDRGNDEFSRLSQSFDAMADAVEGLIATKQALAAAEERNRLARDLHDTAKQRAFSVAMQLSAAKNVLEPDSEASRLVGASVALMTQLQHDLSDVIQRFAAPTISESGFRPALSGALDVMLAGSKLAWTLRLEAPDDAVLSRTPAVSSQLLLITQEAVANCLKHAQASHVLVSCQRDGAAFHWRIDDDGCGFEPAQARAHGMGLSNMRLRAAGLPGGQFDIQSHPGQGTSIVVRFVINEDPS